jgi:hypoxanthine-DNA glycosylase
VEIEKHAFGSYIPLKAETLIIGTFPTHKRNWDFEFFYANRSNAFWRIIADLFDHTFTYLEGSDAVEERKAFVMKNKIAMTDMLAKAIREKSNSGDNQLKKIELMDIFSILNQCPLVQRIILTSRSGKINALNLFQQYLNEQNIPFFQRKVEKLVIGFFEFNQRKINVFVPYSPSPRVERQHGFNLIKEM